MLNFPPALKIFLATTQTDMRKSHDGLAALVEHVLQENPLSGHLFVFRNKPGDRVKLLYWDTDGYALWYKRLEAGRFAFPTSAMTKRASRSARPTWRCSWMAST